LDHRAHEQEPDEPLRLLSVLVLGYLGLALLGTPLARSVPRPGGPYTQFPSDVQLLNAQSNPTLRFPVFHYGYNWSMLKLVRQRASFGWIEISRNSVRYILTRQSRSYKDEDEGFDVTRADIVDPKVEFNCVAFRAQGKRHYIVYVAEQRWDAADSARGFVNRVAEGDSLSTMLILRAIQNFDSVVADFKLQQQTNLAPAVPAHPVAPQRVNQPVPAPKPASPPALVIITPSGAGRNQVIDVDESPLTVRGVAMDEAGIPIVSINGTPTNMRPQNNRAAEFWSDPLTLQPGDNRIEITATNSAHAEAKLVFLVHYTPKAAPPNPRALSKQDVISLLQGGVPNARVVEIVKDRGIKFSPTADDLSDVRAAGGNDELIQAIQQAAPPST
jgi:hypothetical protein